MKGKHRGWTVFLIIVILLTLAALICTVSAHTVRVRFESVTLPGMSRSLSGLKVLYLSDLKIKDESDAKHAVSLVKRLCSDLSPDLLILGGDLTGNGWLDDLQVSVLGKAKNEILSNRAKARNLFLSWIDQVSLPYGKYMVYGDTDLKISPEEERKFSTVLLNRSTYTVATERGSILLAGYADYETNSFSRFNYTENAGDPGAVLVISHDPRIYNSATMKAGSLNRKTLILSAHGLDGQISLFGQKLLYSEINRTYPAGFYKNDSGIPMFISAGIGMEGFPLRLGTEPTAYLITLEGK